MALDAMQQKYIPRDNAFYQHYYHYFLLGIMLILTLLLVSVAVVMYQAMTRPMPQFVAVQANGQQISLTAFDEPNLLPDTLIRWASQAAVLSYTFDFYNYKNQIEMAHPYFTADGWNDYLGGVHNLLDTIVANKLFSYGVVSGTPVISNQGVLPDIGYTWRIQIPFLVTYRSANASDTRNFMVTITIVRVPTNINPQGIGIDQFVMVQQ